MSSYDECEAAKGVISDYWDMHRWKTRHIASVGIESYLTESVPHVRDMRVAIGVTSNVLPPKFAPVIDHMLAEAGLHVPLRYYQANMPQVL